MDEELRRPRPTRGEKTGLPLGGAETISQHVVDGDLAGFSIASRGFDGASPLIEHEVTNLQLDAPMSPETANDTVHRNLLPAEIKPAEPFLAP
ncbi:hypothetical protein ABIE78_003554 [Sinorhizobium fredii]|uniref:Uncharacterized protein n=1 Tax=Sinorhizobium fredii (strain USDA 257) TaxID=1185652 RepID=I3X443_SINF2|nr:hypothetical protein [Sinorhizobium fredii]AFL50649.1 hypothetical protein USDA257_c20670 [Sinorhizobium fredii USDA 257]